MLPTPASPAVGTQTAHAPDKSPDKAPNDSPDRDVRDLAVKLLASREHSRLELTRKLAARNCPTDTVERILDDLERGGLLNESRLADAYAAERLSKGFGPLRIRAELREKGLSDELIDPHLDLGDEQCTMFLRAAHDRRFGADAPTDARERTKRGRFLEYRGFPPRLIARLFDSDDEPPA